jgi:hypothetical protein
MAGARRRARFRFVGDSLRFSRPAFIGSPLSARSFGSQFRLLLTAPLAVDTRSCARLGQVDEDFLTGLPRYTPADFHTSDDIAQVLVHPVRQRIEPVHTAE